MEKKKKEMLLIAILFPVLAFFIYSNFLSPKKKPPPLPAKATPEAAPPGPAAPPPVKAKAAKPALGELPPLDPKLVQLQDKVAESPWGRDPFNPAPTPPAKEGEETDYQNWRISGLFRDTKVAVINGEAISVGETYRGYLFKDIDFDNSEIILEKNNKTYRRKMPEE